MNPVDAGNPYKAPEASISSLRVEIQRPPVYTAISLFCWAIGGFHLVGVLVFLGILVRNVRQLGWENAFGPRDQLLGLLILVLGLSSTASYLTAGRWLRDNRGRPGLILCSFAIGMTYLIIWLGNR